MNWFDAILLGIIEGITEFLPISSTGHLTIGAELLGYDISSPGITAFTAIIQIGAIAAAVWYFREDIIRVATAWVRGVLDKKLRIDADYKYGWAIIFGSVPIAVVGLTFQDTIETTFRSLWWVAGALILWSAVLFVADKTATQRRREREVTWKDTVMIGAVQCLALIPGVSRSGATMSAGLFAGFDRVTVTRLSFFLGIPALVAAGILQAITKFDDVSAHGVGWGPTILATAVSFVVGYASIAWLLKFISGHDFSLFIWYRVGLGALLLVLLQTGVLAG
jgi:undecaprenyl-diphosphatase